LFFVGLSLLREWVWDAYFKLPLLEYALIIGILLLIAHQGLLTGVMVGLLVALIFFVYSYSRTPCIRHNFPSGTHFSNRERSQAQMTALQERGKAARALCLQGYIFFGTASRIVETCQSLIRHEGVRYLLMDFRMVQGLDASAAWGLTKLEQMCSHGGVRLLLSGLRPELERILRRVQFLPSPTIAVFVDVDRGLEWIEDTLLQSMDGRTHGPPSSAATAKTDLRSTLASDFTADALEQLMGFCEELALPEQTALFRTGDAGDALYFIEHGEVSALARLPDGQTKRVRTMGPGTLVGELALYSHQPRSADVVTDTTCYLRKLSWENFLRIEREHPDVARQFHSFVIRLLAARLAAASEEIEALL
jgi:SulP family sulfate permease